MKKLSTKLVVLLLAVALLFGCGVGGTIAWLVTQSGTVTNTFTIGNIGITLTETTGSDYKMVPGGTIAKDPVVTVTAGSEACWLFVEIVENNNTFTVGEDPNQETKKFITYTEGSGWLALGDSYPGVFYRAQAAVEAGTANEYLPTYKVFADDQVSVSAEITKPIMDAVGGNKPTLSITAYAVQQEGLDVVAAWEQANIADNYPTPPSN